MKSDEIKFNNPEWGEIFNKLATETFGDGWEEGATVGTANGEVFRLFSTRNDKSILWEEKGRFIKFTMPRYTEKHQKTMIVLYNGVVKEESYYSKTDTRTLDSPNPETPAVTERDPLGQIESISWYKDGEPRDTDYGGPWKLYYGAGGEVCGGFCDSNYEEVKLEKILERVEVAKMNQAKSMCESPMTVALSARNRGEYPAGTPIRSGR